MGRLLPLIILGAALAPSPATDARAAEIAPLSLRTPGLSSQGGLGLLGMPTAEAGPPWQLRAGMWLLGFQQSGYLVDGDRHGSLQGTLQLDVTLGRFVEAWLGFAASANRNDRSRYREDPPLILSLGDFTVGVKLHGQVGRVIHLGLQPQLRISSAGADLGANFATTSPGVDVLATVDLRRVRGGLPLRLHAQFGYLQDRSSVVLDGRDCTDAATVDACAQSRLVTSASWGVRQPRLRLGLGADAAFPLRGLALGPVAEYHLEAMTGDGDDVLRAYLQARTGPAPRDIDGRVAQWITLGARLHTPIRLTIDGGLQAALSHPGDAMGPPLPQVAGYAAVTFLSDLVPPPPARQIIVETRPARLRGLVRDEKTERPLLGVQVRLPGRLKNALLTNERGEFELGLLQPGSLTVEAVRDDYEPGRREATLRAGEETLLELTLREKPAPPAVLRVDVVDERNQPLAANVTLVREGERREAPPDIAGGFLVQAPAGTWSVRVDSDGYLSREVPVVLTQGGKQRVSAVLRRRPAQPSARLQGDYITIKGTIGFEPGTAELLPQAQAILDEVADILLRSPDIAKLRIEGHTDNQGKAQSNQQLSEDRAIAVRNYLVRQGVAPERLLAEGLGSSQPLVPNLTPANRAKNRRIVFRVLERTTSAP